MNIELGMANPMLIQKQIKDNTEDLHNFVRDLKLWEEDMKRKDQQLSNDKSEELLPPVRRPRSSDKSLADKEVKSEYKRKRIASYDYKTWDNFDVEKACEEIDNEDKKNKSDEESDETAMREEKYLKEKALYDKELGNKHVKAERWDEAAECYTRAIAAYPCDPVFYANRALCSLKQKKYEAVEADCTESLKLDSTYVKALLRRAVAREALDRLEDARHDLRCALQLEPNNTQAQRDLTRLHTWSGKRKPQVKETVVTEPTVQKQSDQKTPKSDHPVSSAKENKNVRNRISACDLVAESGSEPGWEPCSHTIEPIFKPPHLRSRKTLKKVEIHDVGSDIPQHVCVRRSPVVVKAPPPTVMNTSSTSGAQPRSSSSARDIPPPPKTSVQFYMSWSIIKSNPHLCFRFLKQIPGEELPNIFKESLESHMFSSIVQTLASEFVAADEPVLPYLQGLSRVRRFSTIALFMSPTDKSNVTQLFGHCLGAGECLPEDIQELRRLYEFS